MAQARRSAESWQSLVEEQSRSGLSLRAFAASRGMSPNTLAWWKYRRARSRPRVPDLAPRLVAVDVVPDAPLAGGLEIVLRGGCIVRVQPGFDSHLLARVVDVLEARC